MPSVPAGSERLAAQPGVQLASEPLVRPSRKPRILRFLVFLVIVLAIAALIVSPFDFGVLFPDVDD